MIEKIPHIKGHQTWCYFKFGEICKIIGGSQPPKKEFVFEPISGYIRLIQIRDYKSDNHLTFIPESKAKRFCSVDDVMIGRYGPPIFQILRGIEGAYNVALMKACPIDKRILDNEYLYYFLHNQTLRNYVIFHSTRTAGQDGVRKELLQEYPIYLPPLNEQKRIVTKIEALQTRSSAVKEELEAIKPLLNQFRQSVLFSAFRGDLTKDWREQNPDVEPAEVLLERIQQRRIEEAKTPAKLKNIKTIYSYCEEHNSDKLPEGWQYFTLEKLCSSFQYGTSKKSIPDGKIPVLRMGNLQKGEIDWSDLVYSSDEAEIEKYNLKPGAVLFNRTNSPELVGKTSIYRGEQPAIFAGYLIKINNLPELDSEYLNYGLNTRHAKFYCWKVKTDGVSQSNINAKKLGKFEIPYAPLEEQKEIVRRIESLFKLADNIEQQYQQAEVDLGTLNQSILAKAFRGELVPQDPNDEPASVLLERIKEEREKAKATAKKSKTKKKSSKKKDKQLGIPGM